MTTLDDQPESDRIYVGFQFAARREQLGLDAETVAERAGYSLTQYKLMEEGKRNISMDDYFRVSDVWYDLEDAKYSPIDRKLRQRWRTIRRWFGLWERLIEVHYPATTPIFNVTPLHVIVGWILFSAFVYFFVSLQTVGFIFGWTCRQIYNGLEFLGWQS